MTFNSPITSIRIYSQTILYWYFHTVLSLSLFGPRSHEMMMTYLSGPIGGINVLSVVMQRHALIFTSATVVAERLCFHKGLSFCLQGGKVYIPTLQTVPPLTPRHGHCSGRYASYWNVFLSAIAFCPDTTYVVL